MTAKRSIDRRAFLKYSSFAAIATLPANNVLAGLFGSDAAFAGEFINASYRLINTANLLSLEFYFVNVKKLTACVKRGEKFSSKVNDASTPYMIVRLPQQHIAEQYFDLTNPVTKDFLCSDGCNTECRDIISTVKGKVYAETRIAGYSYLVFEIDFDRLPKAELLLKPGYLLNWNAPYYRLKVRQNLGETIFQIKSFKDCANEGNIDNTYPFGYNEKQVYDPERFPRAYSSEGLLPSPITAIEAPYRLIVCPKLPDQENYRFVWTIPPFGNALSCNEAAVELWMAKLSIEKKTTKPGGDKIQQLSENQKVENASEGDDLMQLMILGSPDYVEPGGEVRDPETTFTPLPSAQDRAHLVELYIYSRITARTPKLVFTPLGISADMFLKNTLFEINKVSLIDWKQSISFGRDQEVKVTNLIVDACFGLKMLHVRTTKRRTVCGVALLDYKEFIMPLDLEKDFTLYNNKDGSGKYRTENYKCNTPFKVVRFADLEPKRIIPIKAGAPDTVTRPITVWRNGKEEPDLKILAYWPKIEGNQFLEWKFIGTDWHGQETEFTKKLFVLSSDLANEELMEKLGSEVKDEKETTIGKEKIAIETQLKEENLNKTQIIDLYKKINSGFITIITEATDTWAVIEREGERFTIEILEYNRALFARLLDSMEKAVRQQAGAIEDLVADEFNVFKNRLLDFENTTLGKIDRALNDYDRLYKSLHELIMYVPVGARIAYEARVAGVKRWFDILQERRDNIINYNLQDAGTVILTNIRTEINRWIDAARQFLDPFTNPSDSYPIPPEINKWLNHIYAKQAALQQIIAGYSSDDLTGIFRYEYDRFLYKVPGKLRTRLDYLLADYRKTMNECLAGIRKTEANLKSRVDMYKKEVGYAVNQLDSELEAMKARLQEIFGQKWEEEYEKFRKLFYDRQAAISRLKTDFIIFGNNFRKKAVAEGKELLDFFNEYACYPNLQTAQVHIGRINDLVNKEIPLKIKYAEDYFRNQVDDFVLETKQNAAQVFAEVKSDAKELLRGAMHEIGNELGGIVNPELAADFLTYAKDARDNIKEVVESFKDLTEDLRAQVNGIKKEAEEIVEEFREYRDKIKDELQRTKNDLLLIGREAKENLEQYRDTAKMEAQKYFKGLETKILGSIHLKDILGDGFELPKLDTRNKEIIYQFATKKIRPVKLGPFSFINRGPGETPTTLSIYFKKPLTEPSKFFSWTRLSNFTVGVFDERLIIVFDKLEIYSSNEVKNKVSVNISDVKFTKELAFLDALSKNIKIPGTGISLNITPREINANYAYTFPTISGGAFTMDNLKFGVGVGIPLPFGKSSKAPIVARFGVNGPDDKFVVAAGIWGGRGHFVIEATPKYVTRIDTSIEFGGYFGLNLGIARGEAFLMVGIRFVYQRDEMGDVSYDFYAYLTCGGSVTVFGFITVSVLFLLCMRYQSYQGKSSLYGTASVSYSIKIGFFSKSFTLTYTKRIKGTDSGDQASELTYIPNGDDKKLLHFADFEDAGGGGKQKLKGKYSKEQWERFCNAFRYAG